MAKANTARKLDTYQQQNYKTKYSRDLKLEQKLSSRARVRMYTLYNYVLIGVMVGCGYLLINGNMTITVVTQEKSVLTSELESLQSREISLNAQLERMFNLEYVEEYSISELGMIKLDQNQIEQIHIQNDDIIEVNNSSSYLQKMFTATVDVFKKFWEYIS